MIASEQVFNRVLAQPAFPQNREITGKMGNTGDRSITDKKVTRAQFTRPISKSKPLSQTADRWTIKCTVGQPEEVEMAATAHLTAVAPDNEKSQCNRRRPDYQAQTQRRISIAGASN